MQDNIRARSRRAIVLFIGCVTLAFAMFATGLFIGRWSQAVEPRTGSASATPEAQPRATVPTVAAEASRDEPASYLIRAGSFSSSAEAEDFVARLKERGFDMAFTRSRSAPDGTSSVDVLLGPFADAAAAVQILRELRNSGVSDLQIIPTR
ncbi:Cell division protein FtsN [bacterium HR10]|nr:Cell division protein FtsN [bacterium HR10]